MAFYKSLLQTPLGDMIAVADDQTLYLLEFLDCFNEKKIQKLPTLVEERNSIIDQLHQELNRYFEGTLKEFTIPLNITGSPFQHTVWEHLKKIPHGTTWSYAQLAHSIGKPSYFRAVARANSTNCFPIIIPCHRVINSNGKLGGYAGGISRKEWLLNHEKLN